MTQIQAGIKNREFSARELASAALAQIEALDAQVRAFLELTPDLAYAAADRLDTALAAEQAGTLPAGWGPLSAVPMAFKDNMNLTGTHTTCASKMLENYISPYTATCVEKSLAAGALPLGKLNMDEFAFGSSTETSAFHYTYNPWDLSRVPGGSSGGSAAAVAAGMVTASLGSDTGGSIRQPASFCGVVGYKPSYGMVSRHGVVAFGSSLDQVGPFARSVADVAAVTDAISGYDPYDTTSQKDIAQMSDYLNHGVKGLRIGYVPAFLELDGLAAEMRQAVEDAMHRLESLGAELIPIDLPHARAALAAYYVIGPAEAFSNMSRFDAVRYGYTEPNAANLYDQYELSRAHGFGPEVIRRIVLGCYLLSAGVFEHYYYPAQQIRTLITSDFQQAFTQCAALITPVSPRAAFQFAEVSDPLSMYLSDIYTIPANIAGNGALSLPIGFGDESGLPVGVQIIGPQLKDENIFITAAALEGTYDIARLAPLAKATAAVPTMTGAEVATPSAVVLATPPTETRSAAASSATSTTETSSTATTAATPPNPSSMSEGGAK
ncbi:MAG: Asp-tRNA(Asn)/Glu-tRNA(Gln) amidotransferase subunit GatA [Coriobacteriales bacterium]|nr:Asp-tRNA(Asn)/Glu-tRNA(Gln) amidotransferase subunit GatA [Coriobacteriales bacterium]